MRTKFKIDQEIQNIDRIICRHIENLDIMGRGAVSQDILSQLRNFLEHIMLKIYANGSDIDNTYHNICEAIQYVKTRGELKDLVRFHDYLQIVASHYALDEENSERLMLKYYEHLLKTRKLCKEKLELDVLSNLDEFPIKLNSDVQEYYEKIACRIEAHSITNVVKNDKYYIQKIKPFFVNEEIYYEVTFMPATDYTSKFERIIAFTKLAITDYYAVKLALKEDSIEILGKTMPATIIVGWEVAIRDCEFKNFSFIMRGSATATRNSEQRNLAQFLTTTGFNLTEIVSFPDEEFYRIKQLVTRKTKIVVFFDDLEKCRRIIKNECPGANLLRYILYHMNNKVIKYQRYGEANKRLSDLYVLNGCIPFDNLPFNFSPREHNPKLRDLFACIDSSNRQYEILARIIKNNTEMKGQLFTPVKGLAGFEDIEELAKQYNSSLWSGHYEDSRLVIEKGYIYINGYKKDTAYIIDRITSLAQTGVMNYTESIKEWLNQPNNGVDCDEKKEALTKMFANSQVALIYGPAGTGKSTLINHIAHYFASYDKLFLAQTNPAVDNLQRRIKASKCTFSTIAKFLKRRNNITNYDVLIIDECSTVNNRDMRDILLKAKYNLLVLVGDTYQIASIRFGNWFSVARAFAPETSIIELTNPYRSNDENLKLLWDRVRNMEDTIHELMGRQKYALSLDNTIFNKEEDDEIILCLNYDGLYGINNINRFLQENNPNQPVQWGMQQYKVNDPILFNESERFAPVIYNNMKGRIVGVEVLDKDTISERIQFDIEIDRILMGLDSMGQDFELLEGTGEGNSVIRFCVNKLKSTDDDDENTSKAIVPFQIAYAVSIHKAQGLEYKSVKIVITDEVDEMITHNIFYTAITRAREKLKIYWSPEVGDKILSQIKPRDNSKDIAILRIL